MGLTQKYSKEYLNKNRCFSEVWVRMSLTQKCSIDDLDKYGCFSEVWGSMGRYWYRTV